MNLSKPLRALPRLIQSLFRRYRMLLPLQRCCSFASPSTTSKSHIGPIYVINLDRQPERFAEVTGELSRVKDLAGSPLSGRIIRFSACDARSHAQSSLDTQQVEPLYTLGDQLLVEPQPDAMPDEFDLVRPIRMSVQEIAVARSHIGVWRTIAMADAPYALVLEDDVWLERCLGRVLDQAWEEMGGNNREEPIFDILYISYKEARHGAPKELISKNVFRPERGLWFLSGYVLSRQGAKKLLSLLPCRGPIDLWINQKFQDLHVRALRRSVVNQRPDLSSTNSYSILPALSGIGVIRDAEAALYHQRPVHCPVFAFGAPGSRLSSLAMALSMLGYRVCSDIENLPEIEMENLTSGHNLCIFNAYVNVASLWSSVRILRRRYPGAKFIVVRVSDGCNDQQIHDLIRELRGADVVFLEGEDSNSWRALCEHLRLPPPVMAYPVIANVGLRRCLGAPSSIPSAALVRELRRDPSPWVAETHADWSGLILAEIAQSKSVHRRLVFEDKFSSIDIERWLLRNDTFPGNLGLFRPSNVMSQADGGLSMRVLRESLGVRDMSAAAITSRVRFSEGRFEVALQATNVSGLVTGFFLHRDSPRQEIDIEIAGNRPTQLLVNVFYNPGVEGSKFDYGYRGTPATIPLNFDASKGVHRYAIEWSASEIRWFVDGQLVYRRFEWGPTPIPHLPMSLHVNIWPTRSRELAGRLTLGALPASSFVSSISIDAIQECL